MGSDRIDSSGNGRKGADAKGKKAASPDPDALVAEIEATREDLAETIDAIADRVSPQRVKERSKDKLREVAGHAKEVVSEKAATAKVVVSEKAATVKGSVSERAATAKGAVADARTSSPQDGSVAVAGSEAPGTTDLPPTTGVQVPQLSPRPGTGTYGASATGPSALEQARTHVQQMTPQGLAGVAAVVGLLLLLRRRSDR